MSNNSMGMFGHVPTAAEIGAKAFVMPRDLQSQWSWAAYCAGLSDAGVPDADVVGLLMAACNGEFSHNLEPMFGDELEDPEGASDGDL